MGGRDVPGDHQLGVLEEIEAAGIALGERRDERVAGLSASAADALDVVRLGRRDSGQHHGREVADVDAHLERGRGSEHVRRVGASAALKPVSTNLPSCARQQARVLSRDDASDLALAIQRSVVVGGQRRRDAT